MLDLLIPQLIKYIPVGRVYKLSLTSAMKPTRSMEKLLKDIPGKTYFCLSLKSSKFGGVLITDQTLALNNGVVPPIGALKLNTLDGDLYLFKQETFISPGVKKGEDYELRDPDSGDIFGYFILSDTPLVIPEQEEYVQVSKLADPDILPPAWRVLGYTSEVVTSHTRINNDYQVKAKMDHLIGGVAYSAYLDTTPLTDYLDEIKSLYTQQQEKDLPLSTYYDALGAALFSTHRKTGWLLPPKFDPTGILKLPIPSQITFDEMKALAFEGLSENINNAGKRMELVLEWITLIAKSAVVKPVEVVLLVKFLATQSHLGLHQNEMKRQISQQRVQHFVGQFGDASTEILTQRLEAQKGYKCPDQKNMWWWDGVKYIRVSDQVIRQTGKDYSNFVLGCLQAMLTPRGFTARLNSMQLEAVKSYFVEPLCTIPEDQQPFGAVNLLDGVLKIDGQVTAPNKSYGFNYTLPLTKADLVNAQPPAEFLAMLENYWGHREDCHTLVDGLQEAFAATLFQVATRYQKAFMLYGVANSGKTQVLNILRGLLPGYKTVSVDPSLWAARRNAGKFPDAMLNVCPELAEDSSIRSETFKQVIDGSNLTHASIGGAPIRSLAAHWFASNHLPRSSDNSMGFARRWFIFPFEKAIHSKATLKQSASNPLVSASNSPIPNSACENTAEIVDIGAKILNKERKSLLIWAISGGIRLDKAQSYSLPSDNAKNMLKIHNFNNTLSRYLCESNRVECVWDSQTYSQLMVLSKEALIESLKSAPYLMMTDLIRDAEAWIKSKGLGIRVLNSLSGVEANQCIEELGEALHIIKAGAEQGVVVFGVRFSTKKSLGKGVGVVEGKGTVGGTVGGKGTGKGVAKKVRPTSKPLPWEEGGRGIPAGTGKVGYVDKRSGRGRAGIK